MNDFHNTGKVIIMLGAVLLLTGIAITFWDKIPLLGKLPGDLLYKGKKITIYFPIITSILLSLIISLILYFFRKL